MQAVQQKSTEGYESKKKSRPVSRKSCTILQCIMIVSNPQFVNLENTNVEVIELTVVSDQPNAVEPAACVPLAVVEGACTWRRRD
jgi:hypothetical protein